MKNPIERLALAYAGLKSGQQILYDLNSVVLNESPVDMGRFGLEQICRLGAAPVAALGIDKAVSYAEEIALPKWMRGAVPIVGTTIVAGVVVNYFGHYMNMEEGLGILETTRQLVNNYQESLAKLVTFDATADAGYLTGALLTVKSGARLAKNICESIAHYAKKTRAKSKNKEEQEINDISNGNNTNNNNQQNTKK